MDAMVSARVPVELRDQVNQELHKIGSSPTELINSAYEFFLNTKMLPSSSRKNASGRRKLTKAQVQKLRQSLEETTCQVPEAYFQGKTYDQLLEERLRAMYVGSAYSNKPFKEQLGEARDERYEALA